MCRVSQGEASHPREQAYQRFMERAGLAVPQEFLISQNHLSEEDGLRTIENLFRGHDAPTAIFCGNDRTALIAMKRLKAAGLQVPRDVSLIGFDNLRLTDQLEVPRYPESELVHNADGTYSLPEGTIA